MPTTDSHPHPDLVLNVHQKGSETALSLTFQLRIQHSRLGLGVFEERYESIETSTSPQAYLASLFEHIEELPIDGADNVEARLAGIGVDLAEKLLPEKLRERLWTLRDAKPAPSLLLISNALWIPWELFKLRDPDEHSLRPQGPFLVEAFALTRWIEGRPQTLELPLQRMALVVPDDWRLDDATREAERIHDLDSQVTDIPATYTELLEALASGDFDGWHFSGHSMLSHDHADLQQLILEDDASLTATDLADRARGLGKTHPWVFLNACNTARSGFHLTGLGGLAQAFLRAGAGAFLGTNWALFDQGASDFAIACYEYFYAGRSLGEAVRRARVWFGKKNPGDPRRLAYAAFGHPLAVRSEMASRWSAGERTPLHVPNEPWDPTYSPEGALLRAEYGVVPFHARTKELGELREWCHDDDAIGVRLLTGAGGMGKTRLLLEACRERVKDGWEAGFMVPEADRSPSEAWECLRGLDRPLLMVVDYAEIRRHLLITLLQGVWQTRRADGPRVRLVLLARAALDWWEQLRTEGHGVDELLGGPATTERSLRALALSPAERENSFHLAARAFAQCVESNTPTEAPANLDAEHFDRVLYIHMTALAAAQGIMLEDEDAILDHVLGRERRFWHKLAEQRALPSALVPGLGRAMAAITLGGGAETETEAVASFEELDFFKGSDRAALVKVARLLHELYPGGQWIEPLQPDLLGEHLIDRELEAGSEDLLELILK